MHTTTVVIGGGHAGLAMSRRLTERSIDHVVLERGEVANSWRTERWPSLRMLTPNWQTKLPGFGYSGAEPDSFMTAAELAELLARYAATIDAPVRTGTTVQSVRCASSGYEVVADTGTWHAPTVVLATGACNIATTPVDMAQLPPNVAIVTPLTYRGPDALAYGEVLVVGASATGVQLADEIHRSGREVTIAVGEHVRMPRTYRGRDIFWWMDRTGVLDERYDQVDDIVRARHVPSPQLVGSPARTSLDLNALTDAGVRIVGRLARVVDGRAQLAGSLANVCALADLKMNRLLTRFDDWTDEHCVTEVDAPQRFDHTRVPAQPALELDLRAFRTIVFATGYRPDYSWLGVPVLDGRGRIRHDGGVVNGVHGLYVVGLPFLRRRRSSFIHGAGPDTEELATHLHHHLDRCVAGVS